MANPDHVRLVQAGAHATWEWRGERLDLRDADLSGLRLRDGRLDRADLRGARLVGADLTGTRLQEAALEAAHLIRAVLNDVQLGGARCAGALFCAASLRRAVCVRGDFRRANLTGCDLEKATLTHARLAGALLQSTNLVDADLHGVLGLDEVIHEGPSELGTHSLLRLGNELPAEFLRGVGLPDSFIRYLPAIVASSRPVDFSATFLCAATADSELAHRLQHDLRAAGIRCWLRLSHPENIEFDAPIRLHERLVIVCSKHTASDPWLAQLLRSAERPGPREPTLWVLADDCWNSVPPPPGTPMFDFSRWHDFRNYAQAFDQLVESIAARRSS
jgi:uncharacterized protein YjbI with pentapeptide repeats